MRNIEDILHFRSDLSPFLTHLTRAHDEFATGEASMRSILANRSLHQGSTHVSDARFGGHTLSMSEANKLQYFSAICFTETPINEVHTLLEIQYRHVNLEPWGLVFMRERLQQKGVAPVFYVNNERGNMDEVIQAIFSLKSSNSEAAKRILPLVSVFGRKIQPPGAEERPGGLIDWRWEREWRFPYCEGELAFSADDVFVGLCPHDKIDEMDAIASESLQGVQFVDPTRNMKWYANRLIAARQRLDIKYSVV